MLTKSQQRRFFSKVEKRGASECWVWKGHVRYRNIGGYGIIVMNGKRHRAARVAYAIAKGVDPTEIRGMVKHTCRNTLCVKPDHLVLYERDYVETIWED